MTEGATGLLGWLTGDGDDLDDLLRAEGSRLATAWGIVQDLLDQAEQLRVGNAVSFGLLQAGGSPQPAVTPEANGDTVEAQLLRHGLQARLGSQGEEDSDAADQTLGSGLTLAELLEQGPLSIREFNGSRRRTAHERSRGSKQGRSSVESSYESDNRSDSHFCRGVLESVEGRESIGNSFTARTVFRLRDQRGSEESEFGTAVVRGRS